MLTRVLRATAMRFRPQLPRRERGRARQLPRHRGLPGAGAQSLTLTLTLPLPLPLPLTLTLPLPLPLTLTLTPINYQVVDGKPQNAFGMDEKAMDRDYTLKVRPAPPA